MKKISTAYGDYLISNITHHSVQRIYEEWDTFITVYR